MDGDGGNDDGGRPAATAQLKYSCDRSEIDGSPTKPHSDNRSEVDPSPTWQQTDANSSKKNKEAKSKRGKRTIMEEVFPEVAELQRKERRHKYNRNKLDAEQRREIDVKLEHERERIFYHNKMKEVNKMYKRQQQAQESNTDANAAAATAAATAAANNGKADKRPAEAATAFASAGLAGECKDADKSLIGRRVKINSPKQGKCFFGTVRSKLKAGEIVDDPETAYWCVEFDDGEHQDFTDAETRKSLLDGEKPDEPPTRVEYTKICPGDHFYIGVEEPTGLAHQQLHQTTVGRTTYSFVLSVGKSDIPFAGLGVFCTLVGMNPSRKGGGGATWTLKKKISLGVYGSGRIKSADVMRVKDFVLGGRPKLYAWRTERGCSFIDVTDDGTGDVMDSEGMLPYMNEIRTPGEEQRVISECNGEHVTYYLMAGQKFVLNKTVELLVDYGEVYEENRKSLPSYGGSSDKQKCRPQYFDVGKTMWSCSEANVLSILDMFLGRQPEKSNDRQRMNWVTRQLQLRVEKTFDHGGSAVIEARAKLERAKKLFPRKGKEEDMAAESNNRYLGMTIQMNPTEWGVIEECVKSAEECKYRLHSSKNTETCVPESFVLDKIHHGQCCHQRFFN